MVESEKAHKTTSSAYESKTRVKEKAHVGKSASVRAVEKAGVPAGRTQTNRAVTGSVGQSIQANKPMKGMRKERY